MIQNRKEKKFARKRRSRRGTATVELALLLPILVFLFVVGADFSRVFHYSVIITNCARNGALYGSNPSIAEKVPYNNIEEAALADAVGLPKTPTVSSTTGLDGLGKPYIEVTVKYPFETITHFPGIPVNTNVSRTVRMRVQSPDGDDDKDKDDDD